MTSIESDVAERVQHREQRIQIELRDGEYWWGGAVDDGTRMPFRQCGHRRDLRLDIRGNQATPLLVSTAGRYVWSDAAFCFAFSHHGENGRLTIEAQPGSVILRQGFGSLGGAYRAAAARHFPASGTMPDPICFSAPQYNSWIEMQYEPTQDKILDYAAQIIAHRLPPGVLMIDDNWFVDHGDWRFHRGRFPDPARMVRRLREQGFRVMLWVSPFIDPDCAVYADLAARGLLVRDPYGEPVLRTWWNGTSALLDVTHPDAVDWLHACLGRLMIEFGIDGFKFDAGDPEYSRSTDVMYANTDAVGFCEAWARVGLAYRFNEYRACWKLGGQPLIQRLRDKFHEWGASGLADIIPNGLAQGLAGYAFTCPDMVGGGDIGSFLRPGFELDQELFVRTVQCSALFPMIQFSIAPWRILDERHWLLCRDALRIREGLVPYILATARHAADSGEPMVRHMDYVFPGHGFEHVADQFLLGEDILVAPVTAKGTERRSVVFPPGTWISEDGERIDGPRARDVDAPLARLPWYRRVP